MVERGEEGERSCWETMEEKRAVVNMDWDLRPATEERRVGERVPSGAVRSMRMVGWRGSVSEVGEATVRRGAMVAKA